MNIPLNIDFRQILLHGLNLVILFVILYFLLYNPVKKFMDARKKRYEEAAAQAKAALDDAQEHCRQYSELLEQADEQIAARKQAALTAAQQECDAMLRTAAENATAVTAQAQARAEEILRQAEEKAKDELAESIAKAAREQLAKACTIDGFLAEVEHEQS